MDSSTLWFSVSTVNTAFKWYGGNNLAMTLAGAGNLTIPGTFTAATVNATTVNASSGVSAPGFSATGSSGFLGFSNRSSPGSGDWGWYATGGTARLYNGADRFLVDAGGTATVGGNLFVNASMRILGGGDWGGTTNGASFTSQYLRFQINSGDEPNAGSISYRTFDGGAFNIIGAGVGGNRWVRLYDNVKVSNFLQVIGSAEIDGGQCIVANSNSVGFQAQNANGNYIRMYDDGNGHLECNTNTWLNWVTGQPIRTGGGFSCADFYSYGNVNTSGDHYQGGQFHYFVGASGGWNGGPLVYGDGNWIIVKCGGGNAGFEARNWSNARIIGGDAAGNCSCPGNFTAGGIFTAWDVHANSGVFVNGLLFVNNGGWFWTGSPIHTDSDIQCANMYASGSIFVGGLQLYNNGGYVYSVQAINANGLYSRGDIWCGGSITSGNTLYVPNECNAGYLHGRGDGRVDNNFSVGGALNVGSTVGFANDLSVAGNIGVNSITANGNVNISGWYYGRGNPGAQVACWAGDWGAISFAMTGGYFEVSPDKGASGFVLQPVNSWSDARLKIGIRDSEVDALAVLSAVPVRAFEWTERGRKFLPNIGPVLCGLVAQEIEDLIPNSVEAVGLLGEGMLRIVNEHLDAYYIRAIQQLLERIEQLEARP